ncbi:MAG: cyclic nucleotide-binding domain-containing protein [Deltaproteobacteria bacterium]|nr:cyclic nucleotide-binding domain-containing protein [Candidatus Zymogenaceae bacterium]
MTADLKKYSILSEMSDEMLAVFSEYLTARRFKQGSLIFVEKMQGESLFFIETGSISLTKMVTEGVEKRLAQLGPGDSFGELAVIDGGARVVTARAVEDAQTLVFSREGLARLSGQRPDIAVVFVLSLFRRTVWLVRQNVPLMTESLGVES